MNIVEYIEFVRNFNTKYSVIYETFSIFVKILQYEDLQVLE
jgi:hypothetical protein